MRVLLLSGLSLWLLSLVAGCSVLIDARFDQDGAGPLCVDDDDGTPCEPLGVSGEFICVSDACTSSFCGDGFVDARRGEACDDANTVSGDGCEPFDCTPSCALDAECDDTQPCNGTESCVSGACVAGSALADGEVCGTELACRGGSCASLLCGNMIIDQGEDCDDDNLVAGDGCENDCTFTCSEDGDCRAMDMDVCDGSETCDLATHRCVPAAAPDCDDEEACTVDTCDPIDGCRNDSSSFDRDGDGFFAPTCGGNDCDDSAATTFPGAAEICADGVDNDCVGGDGTQPINYYPDCDRDGYASLGSTPTLTCIPPSHGPQGCSGGGWTTRTPTAGAQDCRDDLAVVVPGAGFAETAIPGQPPASDFDYDCNTVEERFYPLAVNASNACSALLGLGCRGDSYWAAGSTPACGSQAQLSTCRSGVLSCQRQNQSATVSCR